MEFGWLRFCNTVYIANMATELLTNARTTTTLSELSSTPLDSTSESLLSRYIIKLQVDLVNEVLTISELFKY